MANETRKNNVTNENCSWSLLHIGNRHTSGRYIREKKRNFNPDNYLYVCRASIPSDSYIGVP